MPPDLPSAAFPELPAPLRRLLPAARWEPVLGGQLPGGQSGAQVWRSSRHVLKVRARAGLERPLHAEALRLRWLVGRLPAPEVVGYEVTPETEFLALTRLPGVPLGDPDARVHPARVTELLARALRELHALPQRDCPFNASLALTLRRAGERLAAGPVDETNFDDGRARTAPQVLRDLLRTRPAHEELVVTHGKPTLSNLLLDGEYLSGFLDVGRLGLADRHTDLALAHRDLKAELGAPWAEHFLNTYGRSLIDESKLAYYALLDGLF